MVLASPYQSKFQDIGTIIVKVNDDFPGTQVFGNSVWQYSVVAQCYSIFLCCLGLEICLDGQLRNPNIIQMVLSELRHCKLSSSIVINFDPVTELT